jgi:hypothetical protein
MPRAPAIFAQTEQLDTAEAGIDVPALVRMGLESTSVMNFKFERGLVTSRDVTSKRFERLLYSLKAAADPSRDASP